MCVCDCVVQIEQLIRLTIHQLVDSFSLPLASNTISVTWDYIIGHKTTIIKQQVAFNYRSKGSYDIESIKAKICFYIIVPWVSFCQANSASDTCSGKIIYMCQN